MFAPQIYRFRLLLHSLRSVSVDWEKKMKQRKVEVERHIEEQNEDNTQFNKKRRVSIFTEWDYSSAAKFTFMECQLHRRLYIMSEQGAFSFRTASKCQHCETESWEYLFWNVYSVCIIMRYERETWKRLWPASLEQSRERILERPRWKRRELHEETRRTEEEWKKVLTALVRN